MAVDSIAYSLTVGFWSGRRRRRRRRRTGEAGFNIKSNNPNLEGGEKTRKMSLAGVLLEKNSKNIKLHWFYNEK